MQKVIVQIDWYTKVILTLIAVLLVGLLVKPYIQIQPSTARYTDYTISFSEEHCDFWHSRSGVRQPLLIKIVGTVHTKQ